MINSISDVKFLSRREQGNGFSSASDGLGFIYPVLSLLSLIYLSTGKLSGSYFMNMHTVFYSEVLLASWLRNTETITVHKEFR